LILCKKSGEKIPENPRPQLRIKDASMKKINIAFMLLR